MTRKELADAASNAETQLELHHRKMSDTSRPRTRREWADLEHAESRLLAELSKLNNQLANQGPA